MGVVSPMYRESPEPALHIGQRVVMLGATNFQTEDGSAVFEVVGVSQFLVGQSGLLGIYYSGAAAPAGYAMDTNALLDTAIGIAAQSAAIQPDFLQGQRYQLMQARFKPKFLNPPAPPSVRDIDIWALNPTRVWSGSATGMSGVLNAIEQAPDPIDLTTLPAQGGALAYPTLFPAEHEWRIARPSELWWYYQTSPSFQIANNGSVAIAAAGTFGVFLKTLLTVYNVQPITSSQMRVELIGGVPIKAPSRLSREELLNGLVQIAARQPTAGALAID